MARQHGQDRVAYLVSQYPKISHAFVTSEIAALTAQGVEVHRFTVRTAPAAELPTDADRDEAARTTGLLDRVRARPLALLAMCLRHPMAVSAGLRAAARNGRSGLRGRLFQFFYLAEALVLVSELRARSVRHVHVHLANNAADIARLATVVGPKIDGQAWTWSLAMHGPTEFADVVGSDLAAKARSATFVACISDFCRSQLMTLLEPDQWEKLHVVRMGIDPDRFADHTAERRAGGAHELRVLFVGRLVPEKAPQVLLRAFRDLPPGAARLRFVGTGPLAGQLADEAARTGQADAVEFVGAVGQDELMAHYAWADVFCLPSFAEGLPVVIMEAMATGLPVVTTPIAGIPELVTAQSGVLVPPGRADALAAALLHMRDADRRREFGTAGRAAVLQLYVATRNATRLHELLHDAVSGRALAS